MMDQEVKTGPPDRLRRRIGRLQPQREIGRTCEAVHEAPAAEGAEGVCGGRVQDFTDVL